MYDLPRKIVRFVGIIAIFSTRTLLATRYDIPRLFDLFAIFRLADKAVELGYVEGISHTEVRTILKKTN